MRPEIFEKWLLRVTGFAGAAVFLAFFAFTYSVPQWVERVAADFIAEQVVDDVEAAIDAVRPPQGDSLIARVAGDLYAKNERGIARLKHAVKMRARGSLEAALAQVRDPDCECRRRLAQAIDLARLRTLAVDNRHLGGLIQGTYMKVKADLAREIRIFTATNAACFMLLLIVSFAKPAAARHLYFPGILLLGSTVLCAWLYVFSQDWLLTIIHGSYVGAAYAACLGIAFLFVCDIGLNRGRVTTRVVNGVANMAGSAFSLSPC
jgi:hypothetical protein